MIFKKSLEGQITDNKAKLKAPIVRSLTQHVEEERVKRTNSKRMLVVTTLAPSNGRREGRKDEQTKNARCHNSSPTYDRRKGRKDEQRMLVVTTLAPPTAGERVARTNKQRMLVVTTLAPPTTGERVARTNKECSLSQL